MKSKLLISNNSDELIIFASGWGCDDIQFDGMKSSKDVLILWDYQNLKFEFDFSKYKSCYFISYSAGVFIAGLIEDKLPSLTRKIAINGNPEFVDEYYGVTREIRKVFRSIDLTNYMDFRRNYLCFNDEDLEKLNKHSALRTIESCNSELDSIEEMTKELHYPRMHFDRVYLSENDKIFNHEAQLKYYSEQNTKIVVIKSANHNIFYSRFGNFDDFLSS